MSLINIKSIFFIQKLFSYIYDNRKLKLVLYNKNIQKIIGINLINYKFMCEKYIVYESKGVAKEYNIYNDELIFKGEYLNGKRNGLGKEYYDNILLFEGEYLNGKKWNGKGYNKNGNISYELKNGNGFMKEYNGKDKIYFEGYYKNGEKNGKGTDYLTDYHFVVFDGEYYNGFKWNGRIYDKEGNVKFEIKKGKAFIKKYDENNILRAEGIIINGEPNGLFKLYDSEGNLEDECEFLNGKYNGKKKEYKNSKLIFDGEYLYDHKIRGKDYINGILEFEGEYLYDKKWNGKGYDENGNIIYELINGNGKVKEYNDDGVLIFDGEYLNGKMNGKGKEYDYKGNLIFDGEYLNGKKYNGNGKEYNYGNTLKSEFEYKNFVMTKNKNYDYGKLINDIEYINGKLNEKGYDENGNIIYEIINGNGKKILYNSTGKIIFEGIYSNGKLNGNVRIYEKNFGKLIFEGEYLDGEKNGKGKEYINNELIFEGEYLNGERWNGYGKEYRWNKELLFEGEYLNGKRWNGYGKEYRWNNEIDFEGKYINGEKKQNNTEYHNFKIVSIFCK